MHKKSFTFGLGVGILVVTAIFYFLVGLVLGSAPPGPGPGPGPGLTLADLEELAAYHGLVLMDPEDAGEVEPAEEIQVGDEVIEVQVSLEEGEEAQEVIIDPTEVEPVDIDDVVTPPELTVTPPDIPSVVITTPEPLPSIEVEPIEVEPTEVAAIEVAPVAVDPVAVESPMGPIITGGGAYIQILPGMLADDIAQTLYEYQIINDITGFTQYMIDMGYTTRLRAGIHQFQVESSFEEALQVLMITD